MNFFLAFSLGVLILIGNMFYSLYSIKIMREHSQKLREYKSLREENLRLRGEIEKILNVKELERYAIRRGFKPFDWEEFVLPLFKELSGTDHTRKHYR